MKPRAIDFIGYNVRDVARSADFYENTLGLNLASWVTPNWVEFTVGNTPTVLALRLDLNNPGEPYSGDGPAIAIAVQDVYETVEELRARGVKIVLGPGEQEMCHAAGIHDPDGNLIMLHQRKDGTAG